MTPDSPSSVPAISDDEADVLFAPLKQRRVLGLAVSGGGDSLALMHLAVAWVRRLEQARESAPRLHVLTVDHGLQPHSAAVAQEVCQRAHALGLPCAVLRWKGEKPETGVEEAARKARYALLAEWCARHEAALVTAHTLEDQAETFLMRLARGSGLDGLCAMAERGSVPGTCPPVPLLRPLLGVSRARLRATLHALGENWHEDPANVDERFERVRLRQLLPLLAEAGLTPRAVYTSTQRLQRARAAIEEQVAAFLRAHVFVHPLGFATLKRQVFEAQPAEIRLRVLAVLMGWLGGSGGALRDMAGLERLLAWLEAGAGRARVLAGAHLVRRKRELVIGREPGRPGAEVKLQPARHVSEKWDGRYQIEVKGLRAPLRVMMLGQALDAAGRKERASLPSRPAEVPAFAWRAQPALVRTAEEDVGPKDSPSIAALPALGWKHEKAPFDEAAAEHLFSVCK